MGKRKRRGSSSRVRQEQNDDILLEEASKMERINMILLTTLLISIGVIGKLFDFIHGTLSMSESRSSIAKARIPRKRPSWSSENDRFTDRQFYRLFRMSRPCFKKLCRKIEKGVGEKVFKSEKYLEKLKSEGHSTRLGSMHCASEATTGEYICGEIKVAIALRLMAGASYLDMFLWINVNPDYARQIFGMVMKHWFCNDKVMSINFFDLLQDRHELAKIRKEFGTKTDNVFSGVIGSVDGWLVKIRAPGLAECENPGKYFCRKGFSAINVQVIVDKSKRVLWRYIGEKGSAHDSPTFHESTLGVFMETHAAQFLAHGIYLVGDSAYALRAYLLTPYDNAKPDTSEDAFNFYLSSNRIYVECAFGEIDRRWGIFWKPLGGLLVNHKYVIDSGLRLYNFIIDYRNKEVRGFNARQDRNELDMASEDYVSADPFAAIGVQTDEDYEFRRSRGRPPFAELALRENGKQLRDRIRDRLHTLGMTRPKRRNGTRKHAGLRDQFNRTNVV